MSAVAVAAVVEPGVGVAPTNSLPAPVAMPTVQEFKSSDSLICQKKNQGKLTTSTSLLAPGAVLINHNDLAVFGTKV